MRWIVVVVAVAVASAGCPDPCVALAERICNCEPTQTIRRTCIVDRVTSQQGAVTITDADREICAAKLDTCTCAALDANDLDACGFVPAGTAP
jgi:hypothetical protein